MLRQKLIACAALSVIIGCGALPCPALAGPEGRHSVEGVNAEDGQTYTGSVQVERMGEVYRVIWTIAGDQTEGIGIGLKLVDGHMVSGPASDADTGIAVSYLSGQTPGNATYFERPDGSWQGVWAYQGSRTLAQETWQPEADHEPAHAVREKQAEDKAAEQAPKSMRLRALSSPVPERTGPKS
jgi:hypothetical protein